jgi:DNA-binding transcriptional regulator YiaG
MSADMIRALRQRLGITQTELGAILGTSQGRVGDWERGDRPLPKQVAAHLRTLARLHDCERRGE